MPDEEMRYLEGQAEDAMERLGRELEGVPLFRNAQIGPIAEARKLVVTTQERAEWDVNVKEPILMWIFFHEYTIAGTITGGSVDAYTDRLIGTVQRPGAGGIPARPVTGVPITRLPVRAPVAGVRRTEAQSVQWGQTDLYAEGNALGELATALMEQNWKGLENPALVVTSDATPVGGTAKRSMQIFVGPFAPGAWRWRWATKPLATGFAGATGITSWLAHMIPIVGDASGFVRAMAAKLPSDTRFDVPWENPAMAPPMPGVTHVRVDSFATLDQLTVDDKPIDSRTQDLFRRISQSVVHNSADFNAALQNAFGLSSRKPHRLSFSLTAAGTPTISAILRAR
jgi:hypothetical protein